ALAAVGARAALVVPLLARGRVVGVLTAIRTGEQGYSAFDVELAQAYAQRAGLAILNACERSAALTAARQRDEAIAVVSHDLRNPVSTIIMASELLLTTALSDAQRRQHLETIQRVSQYMDRMVGDLLDAARLKSGEFPIEPQPEDVASLLSEVVGALEYAANTRQITLRALMLGDVPQALVDRDRIVQALENLVQNAFKHTPEGGTVQIEVQRTGDDVCFAVKDTGCGIPAAELPRVFERYWQHEREGRNGAGLGLAIVKGIIEAHGGRIWAESAPDAGAAFFFTVPAVDVPLAVVQSRAA
ncbi:MAG: GAF domain-containing sensor histidine kinase, partial [Longimicrobiales bacterium]